MINGKRDTSFDIARGLAMCCVFVFHSEAYFGCTQEWSFWFRPFFLSVFFFISGVFFVKGGEAVSLKNRLWRIFGTLVYPYLIFTTLIWIPKAVAHGNAVDIRNMAVDILGGTASWFVAALVVAELLFLLLYKLTERVNGQPVLLVAVGLGFSIAALYIRHITLSWFPWCYGQAMFGFLFLALGHLYTAESWGRRLKFRGSIPLFVLLYLGVELVDWLTVRSEVNMSPILSVPVLGYVEIVLGILFVLKISKAIRHSAVLEYIGRNSLVYYFLNGGVVMILGSVARRWLPANYLMTLLVAVAALLITTVACMIINRWLPFMKRFPQKKKV